MENQQSQQPIIIQERGNSTSPINLLIGVGIFAGLSYFGYDWYVKHKAQNEAGKLDTPAAQAASKIYNSKHWYGDSPQTAFDTAKEIAANKTAWQDVSASFKNLYNDNIDDYLNFLSPDEKTQFFNIINLTQSSDQKFTGKPPVKATLQYDVINNYCFAIASKGANIRKSPEIIGNGGLITAIDNNIVATATINQPLGMMTGEYKVSSDGKAAFIEFYGQVTDGKTMQLKKVWVAASNATVLTYPKSTKSVQAKAYNNSTQFLKIKKSTYDNSKS